MKAFLTVLRRDLVLAIRFPGELANPVLFFVIVITLFPLAVSPSPQALAAMAPGVVWVGALLAALLSLDGMFRSDFEDGSLELMLMSPAPLAIIVAAKCTAHWLVTGGALIVASPLIAMLMALPAQALWTLVLTLLLGTPVLSLVGAIGVALTVGLRRGGALLSLLVLPLYIPVLVFAASAVKASATGLAPTGQLYMLGAFLVLALTLAPLAAAAGLRVSVN